MESSDDSGVGSFEYDSQPQLITNSPPQVGVGSSDERYRRFLADHGLSKEFENSFSSYSSSSSSSESDGDMEDLRAWTAFSKSMIDSDSSYQHNADVKMTPSQIDIMSNHPVVEVHQEAKLYRPVVVLTKLVFNSGQPAADQKPLKSLTKANRGKIVCELCLDDSFKLRRSLTKHKRDLHDMNRPLVCPICSTRHNAQKDLRGHLTLKHKYQS